MANQAPATTPAVEEDKLVEQVIKKVQSYTTSGGFVLPQNYAVENAVRAAHFIIAETLDKDKRPALEVCTRASVAEALFRMVMQGLDPLKAQVYFIVNGNKLSMRRSYQGSIAVAKRVAPIAKNPSARVINEGDIFEFETVDGEYKNIKHTKKFENLDGKPAGAYCIVTFEDGSQFIDIMTMTQIRQSWKMAQNQSNNKLQTDFSEEAIKRTIINRTLKPIINSSDDANMYEKHDEESEVEETDHEVISSAAPAERKVVSLPPATEKVAAPVGQKEVAQPDKVKKGGQVQQSEQAQQEALFVDEATEDNADQEDPANWQ